MTVNLPTASLPGSTGIFEIFSSDTSNNCTISVTGSRVNLIDIAVRPADTFDVLVEVKLGQGCQCFAFEKITYQLIMCRGPKGAWA